MNPSVKRRWVRALRSGRYTQIRSRLRKGDRNMCCLGVLCDVVDPQGWGYVSPHFDLNPNWHRGEETEPSVATLARAGFGYDEIDLLIEANDKYRWSFEDIANYIEAML
jgi:hypothetical protein